jgi:hypothetical protein
MSIIFGNDRRRTFVNLPQPQNASRIHSDLKKSECKEKRTFKFAMMQPSGFCFTFSKLNAGTVGIIIQCGISFFSWLLFEFVAKCKSEALFFAKCVIIFE